MKFVRKRSAISYQLWPNALRERYANSYKLSAKDQRLTADG
ncbi:hypothetical protein [Moorena bouillonii]|nr:hypothetical protein [Moorena bouillonii]